MVVTTIAADNGANRDNNHGLESGSWFSEVFSIHPDDPLSATCSADWGQDGGREGARWRTHALAEMHCDEAFFHSSATLRTYVNGNLFFEKHSKIQFPVIWYDIA